MKITLQEIKILLIRLSIALLTYPICKTLFFIFNHSYFSDVSFGDLLYILFFGLRFDISAVILINTPFILLHIIPFAFTKKKWWQIILITVFLISNSIAILANCVDLEYYKYTLKRTTADFFSLFGLGSDISTMLPQYIKDFWYVILIWIVLTVFIAWLYPRTKGGTAKPDLSFSPFRAGVWFLFNSLLIGLFIIGFRGGLQLRPIMPINASEYVSPQNMPLILNTPFTIITTYQLEKIEERNYFSEEELKNIFSPVHIPRPPSLAPRPANIFIIILESFSKEYTGIGGRKSYTPFLDSLMNESLVFTNAFANGKKSIEGIPAVLAGIPSLMNESFITSTYCSNPFNSIAGTLKEHGYSSAFFHGGTNGTMGFDAFCGSAGFDNYYGREQYNNEKEYDGDWGIWDEPFLQFANKTVNGMKQPFFASVFTLSSHHPYGVPEHYHNKFKEGDLPIYKSVAYADYSLQKFFEAASKEKWFDSTLFIITADHTGPSSDSYYSNSAGSFQVPVIFYRHNSLLKGKNNRIAQQADILPTVLNYTNYDKEYFSFGNDLLDSTGGSYAVNFINDVYQLFEHDYLLQFDGDKTIGFYNYTTDSLLKNNLVGKSEIQIPMEKKLKAIIQTYNEGMIHNKLK